MGKPLAVATPVVLEGHLIDSLTLAKVIDIIQKDGGDYTLNHFQLGNQKQDISCAHLTVSAPDDAHLDKLLKELAPYGVTPAAKADAETAPCKNGQPPADALAIRLPVSVQLNGRKVSVDHGGQELYVVPNPDGQSARLVHKQDLTENDRVVTSQHGVQWR